LDQPRFDHAGGGMGEFWTALWTPQNEFLRTALIAGLLASVVCGVIGSYVVVRRITYIAGGISHSIFGGMGAAVYCQTVFGWTALTPLVGAVAAAILSAAIIGFVSLRGKEREDTVISAIWAIGMAIGVLFIRITPGFARDLNYYLFGDILLVPPDQIGMLIALDVAVIVIGVLLYNRFLAVCFDEEFTRLRGISVQAYYLLLLVLIALTVVLLMSVVGIILVIALLTLPVAIAGMICRTLWQVMIVATLLNAVFIFLGVALSYSPNLPAGATTIILAGAAYLLALLVRQIVVMARRAAAG
jgi:zinc transport system permease protein